jgi:transcriptional regulator with XRE-family HTH domain
MRKRTPAEQAALEDPDVKFGYDNYDLLTKVGELLRGMRQEAGLSQEQLQQVSGIDQADISRVERGVAERGPSLALITRMAHASGYSLVLSLRKQDAAPGNGELMVEL